MMKNLDDEFNVAKVKNNSYMLMVVYVCVFFILLLLRDGYSFQINKNLFIIITCLAAVTMNTNELIYLFCFLIPLYVGLPGNYMTMVLVLRLFYDVRIFKISSFVVSVLISGYVFLQNVMTGCVGIVPMMFIGGVILVLILFEKKEDLNAFFLVGMYSAGVATLGYIMLVSTLNVYELQELLSSSFRLGSGSANYVEEGIMNINVDPNFYGMYAISAISLTFSLPSNRKNKNILNFLLLGFTMVQLTVGLICLSRTFVIIFLVWFLTYLILQKNIKGVVISLIIGIVIILLVANYMPEVLDALFGRFKGTDMNTGNGRVELVVSFFYQWCDSLYTIFWGVGLFNCNVHCMPLQFLFGGGVVMFVLMIFLVISYVDVRGKKRKISEILPLVVTFITMCTLPAAILLNYMFPLVVIGLTKDNYTEI